MIALYFGLKVFIVSMIFIMIYMMCYYCLWLSMVFYYFCFDFLWLTRICTMFCMGFYYFYNAFYGCLLCSRWLSTIFAFLIIIVNCFLNGLLFFFLLFSFQRLSKVFYVFNCCLLCSIIPNMIFNDFYDFCYDLILNITMFVLFFIILLWLSIVLYYVYHDVLWLLLLFKMVF